MHSEGQTDVGDDRVRERSCGADQQVVAFIKLHLQLEPL